MNHHTNTRHTLPSTQKRSSSNEMAQLVKASAQGKRSRWDPKPLQHICWVTWTMMLTASHQWLEPHQTGNTSPESSGPHKSPMRSAYCMHSGKSVSEELPEPGWVILPGHPQAHMQWRNFRTSIFYKFDQDSKVILKLTMETYVRSLLLKSSCFFICVYVGGRCHA